ncbi:Asp-tRNA(Asn)/Glu-tRNA(Gln) amidotransferase subunit GatA [Parvicella tangerina]|uniref:Glutamyl-tRNA(Gln) amidotransferase subunit A n=1 Tax=Parvicella tangerina TaxID=2829795 RepID=A0A916JK12_9FLAO|nr:Asp-tRNA(Asn)/Glu-tRNA(Gln) amidotransferase subunit GatA [Parvicella tangerina]CAG5077734.1 Glutamyl-tRNA(Gln) amidotransferase subunit A [Parvicella tangerina]
MQDYKTYSDVKRDLLSGATNCVALVSYYIERIKASETNAVLELFEQSALERAKEIDKKVKMGTAGKLAGMVIGLKDNICFKGHKVSASSKILEGFESIYNATVVDRLLKEDAIIIARLNCDEFAMGSSNENSAFGNVLNPVQLDKVPGGSSGGSAAAVAEGLCLAALGSDTGGSIRQPASFCGIVGYKPTYGKVSRYGLLAYASSFDQIGPMTHSVEDAALILEVMAGPDEYDSTASQKPAENYAEKLDESHKYKIAYITDCFDNEGVDSEIVDRHKKLIEDLKKEGHTVEGVEFELLDYMIPNYYILTTAEASSNLARYDGAHFGFRSEDAVDIETTYVKSRSQGFGDEVKRRIMLGTFVLSAGYYDAYYTKGLKVRRLIKERTEELFKEYDFILLPTAPSTAFGIGENVDDPITMYLQDIFTVHANLAGIPAISMPIFTHSNGLPFGTQLMAKKDDDARLLAFSNTLMKKK